jgi:hypothetical protein
MAGSGRWVRCQAGTWTPIWRGPTIGFTYLWSSAPVSVSWRRISSGIPWYMTGSNLVSGRTTVVHGGPSIYLQLEVNPAVTADLMST